MAGLTTAWELSRPGWRNHFASITLYERSSMPGGKGASGRGIHGRVEEHGLHVWLGYYDNAFRLMREVYDELDRPVTDPTCPVRTFDEAFFAAGDIGVGEVDRGDDGDELGWRHWVAPFGSSSAEPIVPGRPFSTAEFLQRAVQLLATIGSSVPAVPPAPLSRGIFLSASPQPPAATTGAAAQASQMRLLARQAESAALIASLQGLLMLERTASAAPGPWRTLLDQLDSLRGLLARRLASLEGGRRLWQVADLVMGCVQGIVEDRLFSDERFAVIDHLDFRQWLSGRVSAETLTSPLITGMYDLVFAYEEGDRRRPRFAAGLGLFLAGRLFFEFRGSVFWKMRAGMGDIVMAPMYQALRARGVTIELSHRVERLALDDDGESLASVQLSHRRWPPIDPLIRVRSLPCFPSEPSEGDDDRGDLQLRAGRDFDVAVLAVPVGAVPEIGAELVERSERWRRMVAQVRTVGTQALQVWLAPTEAELGWPHPAATVSGYDLPFDTYSSMTHLLAVEGWDDTIRPGAVGYFCSVLPDDVASSATADRTVVRGAHQFLTDHAGVFWPAAADDAGRFRWDRVVPGGLYARANIDPSDRYVQSLPGSSVHRLRADESGLDNLVLAGDWTNCGLNAGCIEAAVMSGVEAANVVLGRPLVSGLLGRWYGLGPASAAAGDDEAPVASGAGRS